MTLLALSPGVRFDSAALRLPSDRVTLAQMRDEQRELFTIDGLLYRQWGVAALFTVSIELRLAEAAFEAASGCQPRMTQRERADLVAVLVEDYQRYGLSGGRAETEALIADIERQAVTQAGVKPA